MPVLYRWNRNIDNWRALVNDFTGSCPNDIGAEKDEYFINWRYLRFCSFLIFEHNNNRSTSQWRHMSAMASEPTGALIVQQLVQSSDKEISKSRITGGFPPKGPMTWISKVRGCELVLISYASVNGLIASAVSHWDDIWRYPVSSRWQHGSLTLCRPDDLAIGSVSSGWHDQSTGCHPDDIRCYPKSFGSHNEI